MSRARIGVALALSLFAGCGGGLTSLPQSQQDQFNRCRTIILARRCSPSDERVYEPHCEGDLVDLYVAQTSEPRRQRWLIRSGCPREMVGNVSPSPASEAAVPSP